MQSGLNKGKIFVISGPSGSGKTTLAQSLLKDRKLKKKIARSVSFTTRPKRSGEKNRKDYFFISQNDFKEKLKAKKILEWTRYLGYYYGTAKDFLGAQLRKSKAIVLCLDLKGAAEIKKLYPGITTTIFIMPSSLDELYSRIKNRCKDTKVREISRRLKLAGKEIRAKKRYDYIVVNKDLEAAVRELKGIININLN